MASKRATNNSSVVNLEDQSSLLEGILARGGLSEAKPSETIQKKSKSISKKKTKKTGQTTFSDSSAETPSEWSDVVDVTEEATPTVKISANGKHSVPSAALGKAPDRSETSVTHEAALGYQPGDGASLGYLPGYGAAMANHLASHAQMGGLGDAGPAGAQAALHLSQQQQPWMWPQQPQGFPLNYGNFVPNYTLGGGYVMPSWDQEDQAPVTQRQGDHEISEDEDEEAAQGGEAAVDSGPSTKGKTAEILKEQLGVVKDCDKVAPRALPEVAQLLERYLRDAKSIRHG